MAANGSMRSRTQPPVRREHRFLEAAVSVRFRPSVPAMWGKSTSMFRRARARAGDEPRILVCERALRLLERLQDDGRGVSAAAIRRSLYSRCAHTTSSENACAHRDPSAPWRAPLRCAHPCRGRRATRGDPDLARGDDRLNHGADEIHAGMPAGLRAHDRHGIDADGLAFSRRHGRHLVQDPDAGVSGARRTFGVRPKVSTKRTLHRHDVDDAMMRSCSVVASECRC